MLYFDDLNLHDHEYEVYWEIITILHSDGWLHGNPGWEHALDDAYCVYTISMQYEAAFDDFFVAGRVLRPATYGCRVT